jgi:hypothetical protein
VPLRTTQRNDVLAEIEDVGLDAAHFEWSDFEARRLEAIDVLVHRPSTNVRFAFHFLENGNWYLNWQPGAQGPTDRRSPGPYWRDVLPHVGQWLETVRSELEAPDLWAEIGRAREAVSELPPNVQNTPFNPDEQRQIEQRFEAVKSQVRQTNPELDAEQLRAIDSTLDSLVDASKKLSRLDWRSLVVGAIIEKGLDSVLPSDVVRHVLVITLRSIATLFGHDIPELPLA